MFVATLLIAAQEEAPPPLIDVDGTLFVQFALFLIMFAIGNAFLFQPYLKLRERRKQGIDGARAEAEQMSAKASLTPDSTAGSIGLSTYS